MTAAFVDSNIVVYSISADPRRHTAQQVLNARPETSVQGLNEFVWVARRKLKFSAEQAAEASKQVRLFLSAIHSLLPVDHEVALGLVIRYRLAWWDSLMLAVALRSGARTYYSEDQNGLKIEGFVTIVNPFL